MSNVEQVTLLLAEDDPGHARLIQKNLRRANLHNEIVVVTDGQQALDYLRSEGAYSGRPPACPLLVLLDLNMPVLDGYQVLERMKQDSNLHRIPVVVLTTTDDPREVEHCYELGCNVYITKPVEYDEFVEAVQKLGLFLSVVTIPTGTTS
ncbi:MAG: response regulator [Anaerolineae bacterium]|nr:response regulator [Anaerolineae bacterium]